MVQYRQRSGLAQLAAVVGILVGGGAGGALLGRAIAPDSGASVFISGAMLPVAVFLGVTLWLGSAVLFVAWQVARRLLGRREESAAIRARLTVPPGSAAFVPSAVATSLAAACVVGVLSREAGLLEAIVLYGVVGLAYGLGAWWMARAGYFPAPDGT